MRCWGCLVIGGFAAGRSAKGCIESMTASPSYLDGIVGGDVDGGPAADQRATADGTASTTGHPHGELTLLAGRAMHLYGGFHGRRPRHD